MSLQGEFLVILNITFSLAVDERIVIFKYNIESYYR